MRFAAVLAAMLLIVGPAGADTSLPPPKLAYTQLPDPHREAQARALMATLRCLVCQGQSIADSDADMAADMRAMVRQRIDGGERPEAIRRWLIDRYGDYVTYDPPLSWTTAPLWLAPLVLIALGVAVARSSFSPEAGVMGFAWLAVIGVVAAGLLWGLGVSRTLWSMAGAALVLGATGYTLRDGPSLPGHPVAADAVPIAVDPGLVDLRERMFGRFSADGAYMIAADAMTRDGDTGSAVKVVLAGIYKTPGSALLWTGLGSELTGHDGGVSPAALFAFRQAMRIAPLHPGPPFFAGLAYVEAGQFAAARPYWRRALALAPPGSSYRQDIAVRLRLLEQFLRLQDAAAAGG